MKDARILMGMPVTVEIADGNATMEAIDAVFAYFTWVDETFSTYKKTSEISRINAGTLKLDDACAEMREVFSLSEETKRLTDGYFDIRRPDGSIDPSGLVKGWAILHAAKILGRAGFENYYVEAGGDIQAAGRNSDGNDWTVGIRNPFLPEEIVKIVRLRDAGMATSGSYLRGAHIYNPRDPRQPLSEIVSLTVLGPDVYEADRFATAAFAMGRQGIEFIGKLQGFEGYMVDAAGIATFTGGFPAYVPPHAAVSR